jgi:hypothetical protein
MRTIGNVKIWLVMSVFLLWVVVLARADSGWQEQDKLIASDGASYDYFGHSVCISGHYAVVGAPYDDDKGNNSGSAYIFKRDGISWSQQTKIIGLDTASGNEFGYSVCISGDWVIVGAPYDDDRGIDSGSAYIFRRSDTEWVQQSKLTASDGASEDLFGKAVSISGDYAIVGAQYSSGDEEACGAAYIFKWDGESWMQETKLTASDANAYDQFGCSVSISGQLAIVGSLYGNNKDEDDCGCAYIFKRDGVSWIQQTKLVAPDGTVGDKFGSCVSICDGLAIVGAFGDDCYPQIDSGSAYIFSEDKTGWMQRAKLVASDRDDFDEFGVSVSIAGGYAVVGAHYDDDRGGQSGSVYIFKIDETSWFEQAKLTAPDGSSYDQFGASVSIAGNYVVVGAAWDDDKGNNSGSSYIFVCRPAILYVDDDAKGANNGSRWKDAYNYLQDALADAKSSAKPVEIRVAQGIYKPDEDTLHPNGTGDRMATFQLINGVTIKGGYAGFGEPDPNARDIKLYETILSGDIGTPSDIRDNCYHVFYHPEGLNLDDTAILDGFTITAGNANSYSWPHDSGGGMFNWASSPTVTGCTFIANSAEYRGGGMYNFWYSSPNVNNCTFSKNSADAGGGMDNDYYSSPTVTNCTFTGNSADAGGGMFNYESSPTVNNCAFTANSAERNGGGIYNSYYSSPTLTNCTLNDNSAKLNGAGMCNSSSSPKVNNCTFTANSADGYDGGGMANYESNPIVKDCIFSSNWAGGGGGMDNYNSSPTVTNCTFSGNLAKRNYGGGMGNYEYSSPTVENCTFSENWATDASGGMHNSNSSSNVKGCKFSGNSARYGGGMGNYYSSTTITNSTFSDNSANGVGGGMLNFGSISTVTNCILWADAPSEIYGGTPSVTYSDVQGGWPGPGNIDADPCFVDDYHLLPDSPCINAGDPNYVARPNETDMDGEQRVMLGRVDMGADEFNPFTATFEVVNKRRTDRTVFEYDCKITVSNRWHSALKNLQLELARVPANMTIVDPQVSFASTELEPGQSLTSIDTCTFRVDRSQPIDSAEIAWWVRCDIIDTGQTVQHTASSILYLEPENRTGELTGEGKIDFGDLAELAGQWLWVGQGGSIPEDITGDGIINLRDFAALAERWLEGKYNRE